MHGCYRIKGYFVAKKVILNIGLKAFLNTDIQSKLEGIFQES